MTDNRTEIIPGLVVSTKRNGRCVYSTQAKEALVEACLCPPSSIDRFSVTRPAGMGIPTDRKGSESDRPKPIKMKPNGVIG